MTAPNPWIKPMKEGDFLLIYCLNQIDSTFNLPKLSIRSFLFSIDQLHDDSIKCLIR